MPRAVRSVAVSLALSAFIASPAAAGELKLDGLSFIHFPGPQYTAQLPTGLSLPVTITEKREGVWNLRVDASANPAQATTAPDGSIVGIALNEDSGGANGNLISKISPKGTEIRFAYDGLDRVIRKDLAPFGASTTDTVFTYDNGAADTNADGRLRFVDAPEVDTTLSYRVAGEVSSKTRSFPYSGVNLNFKFDYTYDNLGRLLTERFPDRTWASYSYDGSLPVSVSTAESAGLSFTPLIDQLGFHASGELSAIRFASPTAEVNGAYSFNATTYRPAAATTSGPAGTLQSIDYAFDVAGNLLSANDAQGINQAFSYDAHHRLAQAESSDSGSLDYGTINYGYDAAGSIRSIGPDTGPDSLLYECSPGGPTAVTKLVGPSGAYKRYYDYDRDGNATFLQIAPNQIRTFTRNDEGQVAVFAKLSGQTSWYAYDEAGQRATKSHANASGTAIIDRMYVDKGYEVDLTNAFHERHFFVKGRRAATIRRSGYGYSLSSGGTPGSQTRRFYHPDQVGTNAVTTDGTGVMVQRTIHTPFGARKAMVNAAGSAISDSATTARNQFTDHEYDPESALTYMGARYYDSSIGGFLERDPDMLGPRAGKTFAAISREPEGLDTNSYA